MPLYTDTDDPPPWDTILFSQPAASAAVSSSATGGEAPGDRDMRRRDTGTHLSPPSAAAQARRRGTVLLSGSLALLLVGVLIVASVLLIDGRLTLPFTHTRPGSVRLSGTGLTMTIPTVVRARPTLRPDFQRGMVTPVWTPTGYSDSQWTADASALLNQAGASWVEMPVLFSFSPAHTTTPGGQFVLTSATPSLASVEQGIHYAHALGLHVFLTPLVSIASLSSGWVGTLSFSTAAQMNAWFMLYSAAWLPYVSVAQRAGVEQLAIATEWSRLIYAAPVRLWEGLIGTVARNYSGHLTYDMNWGEASLSPGGSFPTWMSDPRLYALGVSEYKPLLSATGSIAPGQVLAQWTARIRPMLDGVVQHTGKQVLLSEVGYRDTADLLYESWRGTNTTQSPVDSAEQQAALNAVLQNSFADSGVIGTFFWGWRNAGLFSLAENTAATGTIAGWYTK